MKECDYETVEEMVRRKRTWTEAAKCAEKEGSIVAADFCRARVKELSRKIVDFTKTLAQEGGAK